MGRELKRKDAKKNHKDVREVNKKKDSPETIETSKLLMTLGLVLGILIFAYLLIGIFVTKEIKLDWFNNTKENETDNTPKNAILASEVFNKTEETYYVYCYDFKEEQAAIESLITSKLTNDKVYRVDITSGFNSNYVGDVGNVNTQSINDLKINGVTMIKISNGVNVNYVEGVDNIKNFINK